MHRFRTASIAACTLVAVLLSVPAHAGAATAPVLESPEASAPAATEGASLEFEWSGALQGDPDTLDRSFFRLEVIKASAMPAGTQTAWPENALESSHPTPPGQAETSATLGVPAAGEYRWRVCAWGVVDDVVANVIQQLPNGCSASRTLSTVAAAAQNQAIGELKVEEKTQVEGETRTVVVRRPAPAQPTPQVEQPSEPAPSEPVEELPPATFTKVLDSSSTRGGSGSGSDTGGVPKSALGGVGAEGLQADAAASREGLGGKVMGGLSMTLPLVPIPFWTLALLLACFPLLRLWRSDVLGMFDWSDGSVDGRGTYSDVVGDLAPVAVAQEVKVGSTTADGAATAPAPVATSAPERGRRAA